MLPSSSRTNSPNNHRMFPEICQKGCAIVILLQLRGWKYSLENPERCMPGKRKCMSIEPRINHTVLLKSTVRGVIHETPYSDFSGNFSDFSKNRNADKKSNEKSSEYHVVSLGVFSSCTLLRNCCYTFRGEESGKVGKVSKITAP